MTAEDGNVLIVDDDPEVLLAAELVLRRQIARVETTSDVRRLPELLAAQPRDVVLLDMNFSTGDTSGQAGLDALADIGRCAPDTRVILMTAYAGVDLAIRAIKAGAADFVIKPWNNSKLIATVLAALRHSRSVREVRTLRTRERSLNRITGESSEPLLGTSPALRKVLDAIPKVAATDANVLLLGDNGTGKELVARAIHRASPRAERAFIAVDLGAIPETLFEAEMFGHRKGAFTDAREDRAGRFELAAEGTLFLDEIGNLSLNAQAKLLGVLQSRQVTRIGADQQLPVDPRIRCATNADLPPLVESQRFRRDLLYRINTVEIRLPPLRDRREDIRVLAEHFCRLYGGKYHKPRLTIEPRALRKLEQWHWPGNVRELQHAIERAVIMADRAQLQPDDFVVGSASPMVAGGEELNLETVEKATIARAIAQYQGNLTQAAKALGLGRATLYRKMARHGLA
ncbi:MAG: sigma-54-dependent Fis family transcriptional regulator [Gammaproteobacteria bacterium]|nr:sigma-54-dependent Fis family transcriptional regulator [Gammaproteobacteria bacterium]